MGSDTELVLHVPQTDVKGLQLTVQPKYGGDDQLWRFEDGRIISKVVIHKNKVLALTTKAGLTSIEFENKYDTQKWNLYVEYIQSESNSMVLQTSEADSSEVQMMEKDGSVEQKWKLVPVQTKGNMTYGFLCDTFIQYENDIYMM